MAPYRCFLICVELQTCITPSIPVMAEAKDQQLGDTDKPSWIMEQIEQIDQFRVPTVANSDMEKRYYAEHLFFLPDHAQ